jgi:hypothetical protein
VPATRPHTSVRKGSHVFKIQSGAWALGQDSSQMPLTQCQHARCYRYLNKPNVVVSMSTFALRVRQGFVHIFGVHILWNVSRKKMLAYDDVVFLSLTSLRFIERTMFRKFYCLHDQDARFFSSSTTHKRMRPKIFRVKRDSTVGTPHHTPHHRSHTTPHTHTTHRTHTTPQHTTHAH